MKLLILIVIAAAAFLGYFAFQYFDSDSFSDSYAPDIDPEEFRFFLGYSGWSAGQLANEIEENSWIVSKPINADLLINTKFEDLWKIVLQQMGGKYEMYANYPVDPRMN